MRKILLSTLAFLGLTAQAFAADNYAATAGSGLTFGAKDFAGVLQSRFLGCDSTTVAQCWTVDSSGRLTIAVTSGSVASGAYASGALASGSIAAGAMVDLLTMRGTVAAGTAASNALLTGCIYNSTPITLTNGQGSATQCSANGYPTVVVSNTNPNGQAVLASSSPVAIAKNSGTGSTVAGAAIGTAGTASAEVVTVQGVASMTPIATNITQVLGAAISATNGAFTNVLQGNAVLSATNPIFSAPIPTTAGGLSVYNVQPTASDNHVVIKAGAGQVYKVEAFNNSATVNYVRLYNATTGFNGCNSATNIVWQGIIPASTSGAGLSSSWELGMAFATGISICVTSGYAQTDTTNATASALIVNVGYK